MLFVHVYDLLTHMKERCRLICQTCPSARRGAVSFPRRRQATAKLDATDIKTGKLLLPAHAGMSRR